MNIEQPNFYHPHHTVKNHQRKLPHWDQGQVCYFVTYMTLDAMPLAAKERRKRTQRQWLVDHGYSPDLSREELSHLMPTQGLKEYQRFLSREYLESLDRGHGQCLMKREEIRNLVVQTIEYQSEHRCSVYAYVVMPNHVHLLLQPFPGVSLKTITRSLRGYSARCINEHLGEKGSFWAREPFDHIVRSKHYFDRYRNYIWMNPEKAKLQEGMFSRWDYRRCIDVQCTNVSDSITNQPGL